MKFTVPDNWKQKEFTGDREYLDAKFVSTKEAGCIIIFGCVDIWEQMPSSEKSGYNRIDVNNSFFSKSDIAEMYGYSRSCIRDRLQIILPIIARNAENILRNTK